MRYPIVLLDIGETLIGPRTTFGAVYSEVFGSLGLEVPADTFERCIREVWEELLATKQPGEDRFAGYLGGEDEFWLRFVMSTIERATGSTPAVDLVLRALQVLRDRFADDGAWQVYPEVMPMLDALKQDGVRMGVVSNWDSRLPALLDSLKLSHYFETVGVSHLEGLEKPAPEFFHRVLQRMNANPEEALHVGDVPQFDLEGARAAGIDALLVDRKGKLPADLRAVSDLSSLPRIARDGLGD